MLRSAALAVALLGSAAEVASAGGAMIETTAPLADRSEASVKAAVVAAIDQAVRGARAMGFAWFQLRDAQINGDEVAVRILATNEKPGEPAPSPEGTPVPPTPDAAPEEPTPDAAPEEPVPATPPGGHPGRIDSHPELWVPAPTHLII